MVTLAGPVFVIARSADTGAVTVVVNEAVLLAVFGSASLAETVAVLVIVPAVVGPSP